MNLCQFLHFNDACPICGKDLTLYMHASKSALWKATQTEEGVYQFEQFMLKKYTGPEGDFTTLHDLGDDFKMSFNSSKLGADARTWQLFFFKVCGTEAFVDNKWDYDINFYDACYYRSSSWYQFNPKYPGDSKKWQLELANTAHDKLINREECFLLKSSKPDSVEKVYALSLDYENEHTKLWYYSTTTEQRELAEFEPNIFEKEDLPLLKRRPDFTLEGREKLLSKLDGWILMS